MPFSPDSSITGSLQTGLTSPTYTLVTDLTTEANSRQWAVSALGGMQTNVRANTRPDPFTILLRRGPYRVLPAANPSSGAYPNVPLNRIEMLIRKGLKIDAAGTIRTGNLRIIWELPAGSESNDAINIRAMNSFTIGILVEESDDVSDLLLSGLIS